jgi:hypothetical protein
MTILDLQGLEIVEEQNTERAFDEPAASEISLLAGICGDSTLSLLLCQDVG